MATDYSKYNQQQYDNQNAYLNNMINTGTAGQAAWAKNEQAKLNSQYKPTTQTTTTPSASNSGNSGNSGYKSTGNVNSGDNKYGTSTKYSNGNSYTSTDGGKTYTNDATGEVSKGNQGTSQYGQSSGWNSYTGATGKQYEVAGSNGTILVTQKDGSYRRVLPTDADYSATLNAMQKDLAGAGVSYTPSYTYTNQNGTYTTKNYTAGNSALQDSFAQYGKTNAGAGLDDFVYSIYNSIGTDGNTLQGAVDELTRLGLTDYLPGNAIYTASGKLIPGNQYTSFVDGSNNTTNSGDSRWVNYGGQSYLVGGDDSNYVNYVNAKTGNYDMLDYIFGGANMASNPYAQQDPAFLAQFNNDLANIYAQNGMGGAVGGTAGGYTGFDKVDQIIDFANSVNNFNAATGTSGNIWNEIRTMLQGGLEAQRAFIDGQRTRAEQNAENLMRQAYVNQKLQGDSVREAMSAAGLGTSGALQSAQLGVQNNYNSALSGINNSLQQMIASLDEQELQALISHTNNMTNYAYQIQNDEQDRAYRNAQLYMQQAEMQRAKDQQDWDNAYKQQVMDFENQQYLDETSYARRQEAAEYYAQLANAGLITMDEYLQKLRELGLI